MKRIQASFSKVYRGMLLSIEDANPPEQIIPFSGLGPRLPVDSHLGSLFSDQHEIDQNTIPLVLSTGL